MAIVVGELVQVVLVLLGARDVAGKRQHLDADPFAVGPRPDVGFRLAQVGGILAVDPVRYFSPTSAPCRFTL